ncbi:unnamed protein product [Polarella glacialis]|uniref:Uncharacterized protein n=1 Tax=Polarella glacialis TaxID=89957 RepID=A0A813K5I7_POLGL|nr:unnamed protein product [Polarella glacialis]
MPLYEEKLINPLSVRFSQDRIWQEFTDGRRIEDSLKEITTIPLKGSSYEVALRAPFPAIEIIRYSQEAREDDGERVLTEQGRRTYGEESWFTFDNRRLYCLQRMALQLWPTVVSVVVKVLFDMPAVGCAKHKFRSTSDGCSVKLSLDSGEPGSTWNWMEAAFMIKIREGALEAMDAVRKDSDKTSKDKLADAPAEALRDPGVRENTTAERFNLGAAAASGTKKQVAGAQLLSMLHGGDAAGAVSEEQVPYPAQASAEWDSASWDDASWWAASGWGWDEAAQVFTRGRGRGGKAGGGDKAWSGSDGSYAGRSGHSGGRGNGKGKSSKPGGKQSY